jgi:hypothetical protein
VVFERCRIQSSSRGICIQLRDEGNVFNVEFRDLQMVSRYHSDPWWGRGETISLTALPRRPQGKVGTMHDIRIRNVTARGENSARICGTAESPITGVTMENVALTLERFTQYKGGVWDNRPTTAIADIEPHTTPAFAFRHVRNATLRNCSVAWGANPPDYFTHALEAEDVTGLGLTKFSGAAANPARDSDIEILDKVSH